MEMGQNNEKYRKRKDFVLVNLFPEELRNFGDFGGKINKNMIERKLKYNSILTQTCD